MSNNLELLQARIKYSRLYRNEERGFERLYFRFKRDTAKTKYSTWFEIVNDRIVPFVKVDCLEQHTNWIMKHIGMDADELLRLKQLTGLQELFKNKEFSKSYENN